MEVPAEAPLGSYKVPHYQFHYSLNREPSFSPSRSGGMKENSVLYNTPKPCQLTPEHKCNPSTLKLRLAHWNCHSLSSEKFTYLQSHNLDILLLQEVWQPKPYPLANPRSSSLKDEISLQWRWNPCLAEEC